MNPILENILKIGEAVAVATVPGAKQIDQAAHNIIEHKGDTDANVLDAAEAGIKMVESFKGTDIADEAQFRGGCALLEQGFKMVKASLKHANPAQG